MNRVFWAIVVVDALLFLVLLIIGLAAPAPRDGTPERGLAFGVIVPGLLVALSVTVCVLSKSLAPRVFPLVIVAAPLPLIAGAYLRRAWIDYQLRHPVASSDHGS